MGTVDPEVVKAVAEQRRQRRIKQFEDGLRDKMKTHALKKCDPVVSKYAECAKGRTFSMAWACRIQSKEMNECLHQYTSDAAFEEFKQQHLKEQEEKQKVTA